MQFNDIANACTASLHGRTLSMPNPSDGQPYEEIQRSRHASDPLTVPASFAGPGTSAQVARLRGRPHRTVPGKDEFFIQLVVMKWNEQLLHDASELQPQLLHGPDRFDP